MAAMDQSTAEDITCGTVQVSFVAAMVHYLNERRGHGRSFLVTSLFMFASAHSQGKHVFLKS